MKTSHLGLSVPRSLSAHNSVMGLCIHSCFLQEEAPLMMAEQSTDLWGSRMSLGVILLVRSSSRTVVFGFTLGPWAI